MSAPTVVADRPRPPSFPRTVGDAMVTSVKRHGVGTTVRELRVLFDDPHVHAALVVEVGVLLSVVDRDDLLAVPDTALAVCHGRLGSRVVGPDVGLDVARAQLLATGRRRLAVAAPDGTLLGLLCLKRTRTGFCTDDGVRARHVRR